LRPRSGDSKHHREGSQAKREHVFGRTERAPVAAAGGGGDVTRTAGKQAVGCAKGEERAVGALKEEVRKSFFTWTNGFVAARFPESRVKKEGQPVWRSRSYGKAKPLEPGKRECLA
jgi:hypothetical protein